MACQFCNDGLLRARDQIGTEAPGPWYHLSALGEKRYCEDVEPKQYDRLDDSEKARLFLLAEIASEIRMDHAVSLYKAIDWAREVMSLDGSVKDKDQIIKFALMRFGHKCTSACKEAKRIE